MNLQQARICIQKFHPDENEHKKLTTSMFQNARQKAIFQKDSLWDLGTTITISFMLTDSPPSWTNIALIQKEASELGQDVDPLEYKVRTMEPIEAIKSIVNERIVPQVPGLNLQFVDKEGMIRVRLYEGGGSSSLIGTQSLLAAQDDHTITFGWLDVATIVHEFSHALGMLHEHQNPSGGIVWNKPIVYEWAQKTQGWDKETTDRNIINKYSTNEITGSVFDPKSIMLYFYPREFTLNSVGTKQNLKYSELDKDWLNSMYPKDGIRRAPMKRTLTDVHMWIWFILLMTLIFIVLVYFAWTDRE